MKKPYSDESLRHYIDIFLGYCLPYIPLWVQPVTISVFGFMCGMLACIAIVYSMYTVALFCIVLNRFCDAIDGLLARKRNNVTMAGAFLDIVLDFIVYTAVPIAFAVENPIENALVGALLAFSFMVAGSSFLAFSILAEKIGLNRELYKEKGVYYMSGIVEGTETCIFLCSILLFPQFFVTIGSIFAFACCLTGCIRIYYGYTILIAYERN